MKALLVAFLVLGGLGQHKNLNGNGKVYAPKPGSDPAYFRFLPTGSYTSSVATGTMPASMKGGAVSFTRASPATCTKANGDLVVLSNDQPCIETAGLVVESAATNLVLGSGAVAGTGWSTTNATATLNYAVAPDGTTTATRFQMASTLGGGTQVTVQSLASTSGATTESVYAKSNSGAGNFYIYAANTKVLCSASTSAWTRCQLPTTSGVTYIAIGVDTGDACCGMTGIAAQDLLLWGAQVETGPAASSYIPTTTAAVTRAGVTPTTSVTLPGLGFCLSAYLTPRWSWTAQNSGHADVMTMNASGPGDGFSWGWDNGSAGTLNYRHTASGTTWARQSAGHPSGSGHQLRVETTLAGDILQYVDGTSSNSSYFGTSPPLSSASFGTNTLYLGSEMGVNGTQFYGYLSNIVIGPIGSCP